LTGLVEVTEPGVHGPMADLKCGECEIPSHQTIPPTGTGRRSWDVRTDSGLSVGSARRRLVALV